MTNSLGSLNDDVPCIARQNDDFNTGIMYTKSKYASSPIYFALPVGIKTSAYSFSVCNNFQPAVLYKHIVRNYRPLKKQNIMIIRKEIDLEQPLTSAQAEKLNALASNPVSPDEDNPELTTEELRQFRRASSPASAYFPDYGEEEKDDWQDL